MTSNGTIWLHAVPRPLIKHVEWSISGALDQPVHLVWIDQPASFGAVRSEFEWTGVPGAAPRIVSELAAWQGIHFEVTLDESFGEPGRRWSHTPELGVFSVRIDEIGSALLGEEQLRALLANSSVGVSTGAEKALEEAIEQALGKPWDDALEPYRRAGELAPSVWLKHRSA